MPNSGSPSSGENAVDELDAGPDAAGILPATAASTQPFAQNRARGNQPAVVLFHPACQGIDLARRTHANGDDAGQQVGGNSQPGAFGDVVHPADNLNAVAGRSREPFQQAGQGLGGSLDPGRDDAAGDDSRLEQAQIVAGKVEDLGNGRNVGRSVQVDAGQADDRLVDDAKPCLDGRPGFR